MRRYLNCCIPLLVASLALSGCGKKDSSSAGKDKKDEAKPAAPTDGPDFGPWDMEGKKKAWAGSWVTMENGTVQAWTVAGDQVQAWDGKEEKTYTLKLAAPCRAYFATKDGMQFPREFSVVNGKLQFRASGAGYRKGKEALFCDMSGEIFVLDGAGKCSMWKDKFGKWERADAECGFKKGEDGAEVFFHKGTNEGDYPLSGDAILSKTSFETLGAADHAAAKALREEKAPK
ncbi:MAG: hypothetical protein RBU30_02645 [Polyangia bacterium]|jgi:hypothetical protein|nr:hypothetical protein [Polyangia bacterium]